MANKTTKTRGTRQVEKRDIPFQPDSTLGRAFVKAQKGTTVKQLTSWLEDQGLKAGWVLNCLKRGRCYGAKWDVQKGENGYFKLKNLRMPTKLDPYDFGHRAKKAA